MSRKYESPDEIPDEVIREQFASSSSVNFSARAFNAIEYRSIGFGDLGWWLPLNRVLPLVGITPMMLRPVFNGQPRFVESKIVNVELPPTIETYEQLGSFRLSAKPFQELARIIGKSVGVLREDGGTGEHRLMFTVRPSGEIVEPGKP